MPIFTCPDDDPLSEVNHCHGPGRGHPCVGGDGGATKIDNAAVKDWATAFKATEPGLTKLEVYLTTSGGDLHLDTLAVKAGSSSAGIGTRTMQALTTWADRQGLRVTLRLPGKGFSPGTGSASTTSDARLKTFYKRFGFVENKGRHKDFSLSVHMYRDPKK